MKMISLDAKFVGGPLVTQDNILVGVVSFGMPCARGYPDGFGRVYAVMDFINEIIGDGNVVIANE